MSEKKTTILLVDDKEDFLETMAERVALKGFEVLTATSGAQAVEMAAAHDISLAVVDLKMPDMDGLVCITELKKLHPSMEAVLLTGYGSDKVREATSALNTPYFEKQDMGGFWDYLKGFALPPTFLLVDDDASFLETLSDRLLLKGFEVVTAATMDEALAVAESRRLDYAVVDLRLQETDGLVLITRLKAIQPKVRTMLLTAFGDERIEQASKVLNSGYFEKQDMGGFWSWLKSLGKRLEDSMAAAGMASHGDQDDAVNIETGKKNG